MGKFSRDKGARVEREVAALFKQKLQWPNVRRHLSQYQVHSGRDLDGTQPFCVQIKGGKRPSIDKALEEAASAVGVDGCYAWPVAFTKADGESSFTVSMPDWVFFEMSQMLFPEEKGVAEVGDGTT